MDAFIKILETAGLPGLIVISTGLCFLLVYVNRERLKHLRTIERMHNEKEAMFREWMDQSEVNNERLLTTVANNTHAITTNSQNTDSLKNLINVAMITGNGGRQSRPVLIEQPVRDGE